MHETRIIITSGEPAGIGPDIIASINPSRFDARLTVIGDRELLQTRAAALGSKIEFVDHADATTATDTIDIIHHPLEVSTFRRTTRVRILDWLARFIDV